MEKVKVTVEVVKEAVVQGSATYADIKRFIAMQKAVALDDVSYTMVKKVAKEAKVFETKTETVWLKQLLEEKGLTRSTAKFEKEMADAGWTRSKTDSFPAKVFYTR